MKKFRAYRAFYLCSSGAGLALLFMLTVSLASDGVTAQAFEVVDEPASYAERLVAAADMLRLVLTLDNLFIILYSAAFVLLAGIVRKRGNALIVYVSLAALLLTAYLDFAENFSLFGMLAAAQAGTGPGAEEIQSRMIWSAIKFHSSYLGLFLLAFVLPRSTLLEKLLRLSLWLVLPIVGVLVYTYPFGALMLWLRYGLMALGLFLLAWNFYVRARRRDFA
ncbi:MAG: hypothetical protein H7A21_16395 [Spirochaetales bacterium]|nr:hypothetical protein [Leptospiraceae bacterium]MCP5483017.1 hypothetical protein [Spirochaetales bacterium]MCP5486177.1 hypothetical protein [Spirochaetales bacterium]